MNEEQLWLAIGNAEDRYIIAAENFERKRAKGLHLLLAAAIILALSVSAAAAVRYRAGIKDIWKNDTLSADTASVLEDAAVNIDGSDAGFGMEARVTEALADERNLYLVWQLESYEEPFPDGTRESISLDFGDITVDSAMGCIGGRIDDNENILSGYVVTDWNEIMQSTGGTLTLSNLEAPQEVPSDEEYIPDWAELFERCEYIDFPEIEYIKGSSLWPREYFPQYGRLETAIDDSGCNILDFACYENGWLYVTIKEPEAILVNGKSEWIYKFADENGDEILPEYTLVAKEGPVPSTKYYVFAFEVERETAECVKFVKRGGMVYKAVTEESFAIEFFVSDRLESTELACVDGVSISCSPISMCILGAEYAPIEITDTSDNKVNVISSSTDNIVFEKPIVPEKIASVKLGGRELLQP